MVAKDLDSNLNILDPFSCREGGREEGREEEGREGGREGRRRTCEINN